MIINVEIDFDQNDHDHLDQVHSRVRCALSSSSQRSTNLARASSLNFVAM